MTKGIDVSHLNGQPGANPINWNSVAASPSTNGPVQFTFIKASEGVTLKDPATSYNAQGAKNAGILFGYYHFARPGANAAADEANNFYQTLSNINIPPTYTYPYALDLETNTGLQPNDFLTWVEDFMTTFLGNFAGPALPAIIIYGAPDFLDNNLPPTHTLGQQFPLWVAHVDVPAPRLPKGWTDWTIWQYAWNEQIAGISSNTVDADLAKN
jgi:lysozyme